MKKVRLNLRRGIKSWSFVLYDSAESAYFLRGEPIENDDEYRRIVELKPGELIEAEWMGSEWVYSGAVDPRGRDKFDKVRLGKVVPLKTTTGQDKYLEIYSGWVADEELPWTPDDSRKDVRITRIKGKVGSKVDLDALFSDIEDAEGDSHVETTAIGSSDIN